MVDLTQSDAPKVRKASGKRKIVEDSDSDIDIVGGSISQAKRFRGSSPAPEERKGKGRANSGPSEAVMSTWKKGDDDMEPSTKMLALIGFLKDWEASGDKTICYSQCWCPLVILLCISSSLMVYIGTSMLDLLETLFSRHGIRTLRFDGKMDKTARDATLAQFKQIGGPKVILIRYAISLHA
jgi:SNF2 family DNA or RNA helicase